MLYFLINWEIALALENGITNLLFDKLNDERLYIETIYPEAPNRRVNFESLNALNNITRDKYCYSLGNLFLSKIRHNHTTFQHLKEIISNNQNSTYVEKELLNYPDNWTQEQILERGKKNVYLYDE